MQGDPVAIVVYATAIVLLILTILEITDQHPHGTSKAAAYADDLTAAGTFKGIKSKWKQLCELGSKLPYFLEAAKL